MEQERVSALEVPAWLVTVVYLRMIAGVGIAYFFLHLFWGSHELLNFSDISGSGISVEGLSKVWFIFVWAFSVTAIVLCFGRPLAESPKSLLAMRGFWLSLNAGVFEELIFRWLVFFGAMILLPFFNLVTFGLTKWLYGTFLVPVANWATFHALEPWLLHQGGWVFGAALLSANVDFRDAHKYLGPIGWINSWFMGMVLFYLLLNYGLVTAIAAHVLYDAIIFVLRALASRPMYRRAYR